MTGSSSPAPSEPSGHFPPGPSLVELAEDYLAAKALSARSGDPGNSNRARRADLCRWGRAVCSVTGRSVIERPGGVFDLPEDLAQVGVGDLVSETLLQALASMRGSYEATTVARSLATLRGLCRHLVRRGVLDADPTDDELLVVRGVGSDFSDGPVAVHAFTVEEVTAMVAAAAEPRSGPRVAWPRRDVAVVELLAGCGTRAAETVSLQLRHIDDTLDRPLLRVSRNTKGGKRREVPLPRRVSDALDAYLVERAQRAVSNPALAVSPTAALLVRNDGRPFNVGFLDRLVRRVADDAGVAMPGDAAAHAFRHHFGVQLALRDVPVPVIQELLGHADPRTTSIYMHMAGRHLTAALDDAGWLD